MNTRAMRYVLIVAVELTGIGTRAQSSYPKFVSTAEIPIPSLNGFNQPQGMAVAADGTLYVADTGNRRVVKIAPDGTHSTVSFGHPLMTPTSVALDGSGTLYVTDKAANEVSTFPADRNPFYFPPNQPIAIAADSKGDVAFVNGGDNTITIAIVGNIYTRFNPNKTTLVSIAAIAFDKWGRFYVADAGG